MGNSPSADLGGGSTHSSRDVRTANPEMEVKRSSASRAPTHNEYTELPASSKPHRSLNKRIIHAFEKQLSTVPPKNCGSRFISYRIISKSYASPMHDALGCTMGSEVYVLYRPIRRFKRQFDYVGLPGFYCMSVCLWAASA